MKKLLILLLISTSLSTFADSRLDLSLSDFCHLYSGVQSRGGVYYFPNQQVGITATSICVYADAYGQYHSKGRLKNGKKDGKWTVWYENGQKMFEEYYKDGKEDGKWTFWKEDGQKSSETNYKNGKKDGKANSWYENGQKLVEGNYKDGKLEGKSTSWHSDGQLMDEKNWKDGVCISGDC